MDMMALVAAGDPAAPRALGGAPRAWGHRVAGLAVAPLLVPLGLVAGGAVVAWAYGDAATGATDDLRHFHLFWAGMALGVVPVLLRLCATGVPRGERLALVAATALFDYVPKYLRSPRGPLYHDELAHWRQSEGVYATGRLFQPNPTIPILRSFPGLHALTAALRGLTGLDTAAIGVLLPGLLHVAALLGVFVLAERVVRSARSAALAALLYSLNPSFLFFDAEYAYESLGIVLCIWLAVALAMMGQAPVPASTPALAPTQRGLFAWRSVVWEPFLNPALVVRQATFNQLASTGTAGFQPARSRRWRPLTPTRTPARVCRLEAGGPSRHARTVYFDLDRLLVRADDGARRGAWFAVGLLLAGACVVTHHLSSYVAVLLSILVAAVATARAWRGEITRREAGVAWAFAATVAAMALAWLFLVAGDVPGYLTPYLARGGGELASFLRGAAGSRRLFAESVTPGYEHVAAYLAPPIVAAGAAAGLRLRRGRPHPSAANALALFGLLYFPSVPFILTQDGNEGARRSWAFAYIGLAVLVAPVIPRALDAVAHRGGPAHSFAQGAIALAVMLVFVGNVSAFTNETYRFPGPYVYGSDVRSLTPELLAATRWFRATQGANNRVVADRFTALALGSFGGQWPSAPSRGFPVWQLYLSPGRPDPSLLDELQTSRYRYMVVDRRMARYLPRIGVYFEPDEPPAYRRATPPPLAALNRYDWLPWTTPIYQSDDLAIYRFDFGLLDMPGQPSLVRAWRPTGGRP